MTAAGATAGQGSGAVVLPMFPLGGVLFPHAVLPLHVFEPRYRRLTADCLAGVPEFGVVLIERGSEVGGGDQRFATGTVARIMSASPLDDGRWVLVTVGTSRFRLVSWVAEEPYPQAEVTPLAERGDEDRVRAALPTAEAAVRRALALGSELAEPGGAPPDFTLAAEAAVAAWQLATLAPVSPMDQLRLLAEDDHVARLRLTTELAADAASVLAYRLSGG